MLVKSATIYIDDIAMAGTVLHEPASLDHLSVCLEYGRWIEVKGLKLNLPSVMDMTDTYHEMLSQDPYCPLGNSVMSVKVATDQGDKWFVNR